MLVGLSTCEARRDNASFSKYSTQYGAMQYHSLGAECRCSEVWFRGKEGGDTIFPSLRDALPRLAGILTLSLRASNPFHYPRKFWLE